MAKGRASNLIALAVALALIIAGVQYLRSRSQEDECARWQSVVRRQAELLAPTGRDPVIYYQAAANSYEESRPEGCALPERTR